MVIGRGMIAKAFARYNNDKQVLIYASGVANSAHTDNAEFEREKNLLLSSLQTSQDKTFVYFSTCSIDDKDVACSPYVLHKINMENLIRSMHHDYVIFRLPQVVGRSLTNRATLVNYLYDKIMQGEHFIVWKNAVRYIIDVDDVSLIAGQIIDRKIMRNTTINIVSRPYSVLDIVTILEMILGKKADYELVEKGTHHDIIHSTASRIAEELNIYFDKPYLERILLKYYA